MLSVAARWEQRTVVSLDSGVITRLVSEQGAVGRLLKTCHSVEIDLTLVLYSFMIQMKEFSHSTGIWEYLE